MLQLQFPSMVKVHAEDVIYSAATLSVPLRADLAEQLHELGIRYEFDLQQHGDKVTTITHSVDWLKKYTDADRLDILRRALQICVIEFTKKIVQANPFHQHVTFLSDLRCTAERGVERDKFTLTIAILDV